VRLGREERVEDLIGILRADAHSGVGNRHQDAAAVVEI
jgi:hypothetical protein